MPSEQPAFDADQIVDRRSLRRKLTFWRVLAIGVAIVAIIGLASLATPGARDALGGNAIARIKIEGLIRSSSERVEALERLAKSNAPAVIVHVNSPGGTTAGAEQLYDSLVALKAKKPVVIVVDGMAASGGYITALAGDRIFAQSSSLVGSIGVLVQYPNFTELLKTVGVKVEAVKSSPLKAAPSGYEPTSPEARAALDALVMDSYAWFRDLVKDRRKMDKPLLEKVADGRVFTGRQAIALNLIDELGDERSARDWLAKEKNVARDTPVKDFSLKSRLGEWSVLKLSAAVLDGLGLTALAERLVQSDLAQTVESAQMQGLLALWRPAAE